MTLPRTVSLVVGVLMAVTVVSGCASSGGFTTPKDTQIIGAATVTAATCESLFGKPADIARSVKFDKPETYTWWADKITGAKDRPLSCVIGNTPLTRTIGLTVGPGPVNCFDQNACGEASNGLYVTMALSGTAAGDRNPPFGDKAAVVKWLTEAATHVK